MATANNELGRMRKEAVLACFKVLSQDLPDGLSTTTKILRIADYSTKIPNEASR
jgi:hypothetical protein